MKLFIQRILAITLITLVFLGPVAGKALAGWDWGGTNGGNGYEPSWYCYFGGC